MANGGIVGPVQTPVVTPAGSQPETITGITSSNPAFAVQPLTTEVTVMVIAGGAAAAYGGGGAGGLRIISSHPVPSSPFPVTIGAGGARGATPSQSGGTSTFGSAVPISASGGGGNSNPGPAQPGGSGGGGGNFVAGASGNIGGYTPPEGNAGGNSSNYNGAGGGGSGAVGSTSPPWPGLGGTGGNGTDVAPTFGAAPQPYYPAKSPGPTNAYFAGGGGGGGSANTPVGGTGGGGFGLAAPAGSFSGSGDTNSGSGGGGNYGLGTPNGGNGGSGMVIVKEAAVATDASMVAPGVWRMSEVYDYRKSGDWLGS